ncbi:protein let-653 isoform X1 [Drosophila navojoa]|uniref:protein let-653 isoform X1 n=1 Tax=Drosophila navojoa TaxID=7232 RepID=UPI0011BF118E|nr:protein let-653 isoform X1 [Drosophila navojoa]
MPANMKDFHRDAFAICCFIMLMASECQAALNTQKTSFSCAGRPAGYYADVETGCQVYHMCDGLGRQFSYTCPNTTLFQQRMLICDHWYMVNCSKAESNYAANLLIGQRDKPFVNDEENNLRTPRPDLLDRPYAPDYSGESFRNQYKQLTPSQNQIRDDSVKSADKFDSQLTQNSQTRWRIPPPSRTILPPAFEPQIELTSSTPQPRPRVSSSSSTTTTSTRRPTTTPPPVSYKRTEALYQRTGDMEVDDLGTSHSTRYNTSADFNSAEQATTKNSTKMVKFIKPPSKIYEPPFVYPIYNQDVQEVQPVTETLRTSSAMPFSTAATQNRFSAAAARPSTTTRPLSRPTTYAGQPFSQSSAATTASTTTNYRPAVAQTEHRTPTPAQAFRQTTPTSTVAPRTGGKGELPFNDLLPPFVDFVPHDIATTQGPPIYYEWKVPANGLVPPKLDPPIGVDGREYPETKADYNVKVKLESFNSKFNDFASNNAVAAASGAAPKRLPSSRSIKPNELPVVSTEKAQRRADVVSTGSGSGSSSHLTSDITQLRKQLLIPEYAFPLETIGRTGYAPGSSVAGDLYNSFQLKIPERRAGSGSSFSSSSTQGRWFGENPKCPECHPSFVVPGTCEPCLRR